MNMESQPGNSKEHEVANIEGAAPEKNKAVFHREFDILRKKMGVPTKVGNWPSELLDAENATLDKKAPVAPTDALDSDYEYTPGEETKADLWAAVLNEHKQGDQEWSNILRKSITRDEGVITARNAFIEELQRKGDPESLKEIAELQEKNRRLELKLKIDRVELGTDYGDIHKEMREEYETALEKNKETSSARIASLEKDIATVKASINRMRGNTGEGYTATLNTLKENLTLMENSLAIEKSLINKSSDLDRTFIQDPSLSTNESERGAGSWEDTKIKEEEGRLVS